jgi:hypothetical protein
MIHFVQIQNGAQRRVAMVREPQLAMLNFESVYALVWAAIKNGERIDRLVERSLVGESLDYDVIYKGESDWRLLPPLDHPDDSARCLVSGTGLTHLGSAKSRDAMHERLSAKEEDLTDSMKMFRWGVEKGRPPKGSVGIAPEWFYKGTGSILRGHNQPLEVPAYAEDGGEEAEIVGLYVIDPKGQPVRVGMTQGNEFSDHIFERRNYLNLAGSKLRTCSIGPEVVIAPDFASIKGVVSIERGGREIWSKSITTGELEMCHSLANIEHHHFKFESHRRPGDVHVHYYGACALSFADNLQLQADDIMQVHFEGFGRPLRNPLRRVGAAHDLTAVRSLT